MPSSSDIAVSGTVARSRPDAGIAGEGHTPGPWACSGPGPERDPRVWVYAPDGQGNRPRIATVEAVMRSGDLVAINHANARLIAAAPALLEALRAARTAICYAAPPCDFGTPGDPNPCYEARIPIAFVEQIDAALSLAEGRPQ